MTEPVLKRKLSTKKKIIIIVSAFVALCVIAVICAFAFVFLAGNLNELKDLNGTESIELNTITTEDIMAGAIRSSMIGSSKITKKRNFLISDVLKGVYANYNYEAIDFGVKKYSGISILQATKPKIDVVKFTLDSEVSKGNLRAVVIVDDEYYADFELNGISTVIVDDAEGKMIVIKIAGEEAQMKLSLSRSAG